MKPTIYLERSYGETVKILAETLAKKEYRVVTSFDLRNAAASHPGCICPHHGTNECTCQFQVFLAYPNCLERKPLVIALHGRGYDSYLTLLEGKENEWLAALLPLVSKTEKGPEKTDDHCDEEKTMSSKTFSVPTIHCGHCTHTIKMELADLPGVKKVDADVTSKMVTVEWDAPATWEQIEDTLVEINYPPVV